MKKSLFPRLALMAVVVALISACSEKKFEYTNVIPANASTVAVSYTHLTLPTT